VLLYRVNIVPKAFADLEGILDYISKDSPTNAARVIDRLQDAIYSLDQMPRRFKVHSCRKDMSLSVHAMPVPPYIVYYRVDDVHHAVRVLRVYDGRRLQPRRFT